MGVIATKVNFVWLYFTAVTVRFLTKRYIGEYESNIGKCHYIMRHLLLFTFLWQAIIIIIYGLI